MSDKKRHYHKLKTYKGLAAYQIFKQDFTGTPPKLARVCQDTSCGKAFFYE